MKKICFGACVTLIFLCACSKNIDAPIFFDKACEAPCWQGIQPGETVEEQALLILGNLKGIRKNTIEKVQATQYGYPWEIFWEFEPWGSGWLALDDQQAVAEIAFNGQNLSLGKYITELGVPEKIVILPSTNRNKNVRIIYTGKNVVLQYLKNTSSGKVLHIDYSDIVDSVHFYSSEGLEQSYMRVPNGLYVTSIVEIWQDWRGIADY